MQNSEVQLICIFIKLMSMQYKWPLLSMLYPPCLGVTGKQCHRVNAPSDPVESHYLRNTVISFLDYVISDLNLQFSEASITCACLVGLVPSVITPKMLDFSAAIEIYKGDLPTPEIIKQEMLQWKVKWSSVPENERPQTCTTAIKSCSSIAFPNI